MIETTLDQLVAGGWLYAALRIAFIALIYLFLFVVLRTTVRELAVAARLMGGEERRAAGTGLIVLDAADSTLASGTALALEPVSSLGRVAGNTIVIDDPHTSARHAELRFARGQWWLRDLGSSNGTLLNDEPVRAVVGVRPGDVIQCGRVRFRLIPSFPVPSVDSSA
ncbi:MAG: transporter ATP-binding protein [Thermomicrobiales bacterium]|nr:transporter ATP-binding protein [Thermomicrobiales bacterium]